MPISLGHNATRCGGIGRPAEVVVEKEEEKEEEEDSSFSDGRTGFEFVSFTVDHFIHASESSYVVHLRRNN